MRMTSLQQGALTKTWQRSKGGCMFAHRLCRAYKAVLFPLLHLDIDVHVGRGANVTTTDCRLPNMHDLVFGFFNRFFTHFLNFYLSDFRRYIFKAVLFQTTRHRPCKSHTVTVPTLTVQLVKNTHFTYPQAITCQTLKCDLSCRNLSAFSRVFIKRSGNSKQNSFLDCGLKPPFIPFLFVWCTRSM